MFSIMSMVMILVTLLIVGATSIVLGLPADTETANAILKWYDADQSGRIELHEFAVLARDVAVFTAFDADHSGTLDPSELRPALSKLGLAASEAEIRRIVETWDDDEQGAINIVEFSEIVRDLQVFEQFDVDRSGYISTAELRAALSKLGVHLDHKRTQTLLEKYDDDKSGVIEFPEFRKLADDLPNLIGRSKGSFFQMHHFDSAYVHAEDILDGEMHPDFSMMMGHSSTSKKTKGGRSSPTPYGIAVPGATSVFGAAGVDAANAPAPSPALLDGPGFAGAPTGAAATTAAAASNPFDSRMFLSSALAQSQVHNVRTVQLQGQAAAMAPLHVSNSRLKH